jgi:hypothetical protein
LFHSSRYFLRRNKQEQAAPDAYDSTYKARKAAVEAATTTPWRSQCNFSALASTPDPAQSWQAHDWHPFSQTVEVTVGNAISTVVYVCGRVTVVAYFVDPGRVLVRVMVV